MPRHKIIREKKDIKPEEPLRLKRKPRKTKGAIIQTRKECALRALEVVQLLKNILKENINKIRLERMEFESLLEMTQGSAAPDDTSSNKDDVPSESSVLDQLKAVNETGSTINFNQLGELNAFCSTSSVGNGEHSRSPVAVSSSSNLPTSPSSSSSQAK